MRILPFLLFACGLFGSVNEFLRWEISSGYRNDRIHWHLQNPGDNAELTYSELNRDVEFWENALTLKTIHRDLVFLVRGAYGTFGHGTLFQKYANLSYATDQPDFQFNTQGWSADANGYFGYAVNLTADRTYKAILIPLIGLSGHFERLKRHGASPFESPNAVGANEYTLTSEAKPLRMSWWGVFIGGGFIIEPGGRFIFNGGYSYHWMRFRLHTGYENELFFGSPIITQQITTVSLKVDEGGNHGHSGWGQIDYILNRAWRCGIGGQIHYFFSGVIATTLHNQVQTLLQSPSFVESDIAQKLELRWITFSGWVQISREF
ncbi:MAG TPA: hypothetical protein VLE89_03940 [Chlamydiales bacterium]|nr:hypothetical protein [Chlamydiales bacterium]